jgi:hypothetical protein
MATAAFTVAQGVLDVQAAVSDPPTATYTVVGAAAQLGVAIPSPHPAATAGTNTQHHIRRSTMEDRIRTGRAFAIGCPTGAGPMVFA